MDKFYHSRAKIPTISNDEMQARMRAWEICMETINANKARAKRLFWLVCRFVIDVTEKTNIPYLFTIFTE